VIDNATAKKFLGAVGLSLHDRLKHLLPGSLYYTHKIAKEARKMEPELAILGDIVPAGRTAIDVGANRGYYSYALSRIAGRVEAFEPHPGMAQFARRSSAAASGCTKEGHRSPL
jgi:hypothetical protein